MTVTLDGDRLHAGREARERFYDSRGYGRSREGNLELAPVEATHLLFRGDIESVRDQDGERLGFDGLLASPLVSEVAFFVYKDLRDRGFYLSPVDLVEDDRAQGAETADATDGDGAATARGEFLVYPRGEGPWDDTVAYRMLAVSEREAVSTAALESLLSRAAAEDATAVLAVVDEESEVTYLECAHPTVTGTTDHDHGSVHGVLLSDRVLVSDPTDGLYDRAFFGQRLDPDGGVQLSLVEAAHLAATGALTLESGGGVEPGASDESDTTGGGLATLLERGRAVEGERFDRRLSVYTALRTRGVVPKTGFKFGADFRTYSDVESVDSLGHSELLVRVLPGDHVFGPRDLALDVRLAHGVRKRMVFALVDGASRSPENGGDPTWLVVERLTP